MLAFFGAWANVPFTIAFGATVLFALLSLTGLVRLLGGGADADVDVDADVDAAADVDADADAGADADAETDAGSEGAHTSFGAALLTSLGAGRVPVTWTAQLAGLTFGLTGLAANAPFGETPPVYSLAWTLPVATLVAYAASALFARVMAPITDDRQYAAARRSDLVGHVGVVISSRVDHAIGEVRIRDERTGHDVRVVCTLDVDSRPLREGDEAVVVGEEQGRLRVAALDALVERASSGAERSAGDEEERAIPVDRARIQPRRRQS